MKLIRKNNVVFVILGILLLLGISKIILNKITLDKRTSPAAEKKLETYRLPEDIKKELQERIDAALAAGIQKENIIVDPGIGFGKTVEQNLELVNRLAELKELGYQERTGQKEQLVPAGWKDGYREWQDWIDTDKGTLKYIRNRYVRNRFRTL